MLTTDLGLIQIEWEDCAEWFGCRSYVRRSPELDACSRAFADGRKQTLEALAAAGYDYVSCAIVGLATIVDDPIHPPMLPS